MAVSRLILREYLQALGWPGLLGAGCALLALALLLLAVLPGWHARTDLQQALQAAAEQRLAIAEGRLSPPQAAPGEALERFHRSLPAQLDATSAIDRLYVLAGQQRIVLARGEYALGLDPKTRLARYQILLPIRGSYPQLRRFLHALQAELPALVLEDLDVQRKRIAEPELSGRLRLTLYLSRSS